MVLSLVISVLNLLDDFNLSSQNFTATLIMRIRSFLAFVISICITFAFVPVKTFAFSEEEMHNSQMLLTQEKLMIALH